MCSCSCEWLCVCSWPCSWDPSILLSSFPTHITASSVAEAFFQKLVPYRSVVKSMLYLSRLMTRPAHVFANCMDCGEINS